MATGEENEPLLSNDFIVSNQSTRNSHIKSLYETNNLFKQSFEHRNNEANRLQLPNSSCLLGQVSDCVVSIFVIAFDTKAGMFNYALLVIIICVFILKLVSRIMVDTI